MPSSITEAHVAFPISNDLLQKTITVIENLSKTSPRKKNVPLLTEVLLGLIDAGLEYFFIYSTHMLGIGVMGQKVVDIGVTTSKKGLHMIISKLVKRMNDDQLLKLANFLDEMLFQKNILHPSDS